MTEVKLSTLQLFFPEAAKRASQLEANNTRLIHYTSAQNAMNIIKYRKIWLRNTAVMNDLQEVSHGVNLLSNAAKLDAGNRLWHLMDKVEDGLGSEIKSFYYSISNNIRHNTFITSLSEHPQSEDHLGRLSMWRAYGGSLGVGLVLRLRPFLANSSSFPAYTSPVLYALEDEFYQYFENFVNHLEKNISVIKKMNAADVLLNMTSAANAAALSTKHKGFEEELEWRVIADITSGNDSFLELSTECVHGLPQRVLKIDLKDYGPSEIDISIPMLLESVIIGPTSHPQTIYDAFCDLMKEAGVPNAASLIRISGIPLRT